MGNSIPPGSSSTATGKIILSDGTVHRYKKALTVAELMLEFPQQHVFELHKDMTNGKKIPPLPADKHLEMNKVYLMIPIKRGKPTSLTSEEARRVLINASFFLKSKMFLSSSKLVPLLSRIYPPGCGGNMKGRDVQEEETMRNSTTMIQLEESRRDIFAEVVEGRPGYLLGRQVSGEGWKPSLDTIKEKSMKRKIRHWFLKNPSSKT